MKELILAFLLGINTLSYGAYSYGDFTVEKIINVYDGDTFRVNIADLPDIVGDNISIRINGIDTPELRESNQELRNLAHGAKRYLNVLLKEANTVELRNIQRGKYFRLVADVYVDGDNVADIMIKKGYALPYYGKTKPDWELMVK